MATVGGVKKGPGSNPRRKNGIVRNPQIKRSPQALVTYQGWLYKQGSDGLMLWKKRWFVLSEFCLFYYEGPEEEKVLGSILLPSYKVSPCGNDDRVHRKFCFKAEHQNMRTYYFAADTKEAMIKWMNCISLATILQQGAKLETYRYSRPASGAGTASVGSLTDPSNPGSEHNFHTVSYRRTNDKPTTNGRHYDTASEDSRFDASFDSRQSENLDSRCKSAAGNVRPSQPVYANAPPKPKRLNTSRDYSSSPERSPERGESAVVTKLNYPIQAQQFREQVHRIAHPLDLQQPPPPPDVTLMTDARGSSHSTGVSAVTVERRTPDAYGRSKADYEAVDQGSSCSVTSSSCGRSTSRKHERSGATDYAAEPYRSRGSSRTHGGGTGSTTASLDDERIHHQTRVPPMRNPFRPQSADILDPRNGTGSVKMKMPPPSFRDHPDPWSEEAYALQMRHMTERLAAGGPGTVQPTPRHQVPERTTPGYRSRSRPDYNGAGISNEYAVGLSREELISRDVKESAWWQYVTDPPRPHRRLEAGWSTSQENLLDHSEVSYLLDKNRNFHRSASARLPQRFNEEQEPDDEMESRKVEQREESMKRLLEWKQRMLQSPLTRKARNPQDVGMTNPSQSRYATLGSNNSHHRVQQQQQQPQQLAPPPKYPDPPAPWPSPARRVGTFEQLVQSFEPEGAHYGVNQRTRVYGSNDSDRRACTRDVEELPRSETRASNLSVGSPKNTQKLSRSRPVSMEINSPEWKKSTTAALYSNGWTQHDHQRDSNRNKIVSSPSPSAINKSSQETASPVQVLPKARRESIKIEESEVVQEYSYEFVQAGSASYGETTKTPPIKTPPRDWIFQDSFSTSYKDKDTIINGGNVRVSKHLSEVNTATLPDLRAIATDEDTASLAESLPESLIGFANEMISDSNSPPPGNTLLNNEISSSSMAPVSVSNNTAMEDFYLPMNSSKLSLLSSTLPKRNILVPFPSSTGNKFEENTYVEMIEGGPNTNGPRSVSNNATSGYSLFATLEDSYQVTNELGAAPESPRYSEIQHDSSSVISQQEEPSHYELIYRPPSRLSEPVYMEVPPLLEPANAQALKALYEKEVGLILQQRDEYQASMKEDIQLRIRSYSQTGSRTSSHSDMALKEETTSISEQELSLLTQPKHPRFSLSDTFRPASYYLGLGNKDGAGGTGGNGRKLETILAGDQDPEEDSSDSSDLVSPPSIPNVSPPCDDEELAESLSKSNTQPTTSTPSSRCHSRNQSLDMDPFREADHVLRKKPLTIVRSLDDILNDAALQPVYENVSATGEGQILGSHSSRPSSSTTNEVGPWRHNSNPSEGGTAPYYYSDLSLKSDSDSVQGISPNTTTERMKRREESRFMGTLQRKHQPKHASEDSNSLVASTVRDPFTAVERRHPENGCSTGLRRSRSLEGVLDGNSLECMSPNSSFLHGSPLGVSKLQAAVSHLPWDEDGMWRDNLRRASIRHHAADQESLGGQSRASPRRSGSGFIPPAWNAPAQESDSPFTDTGSPRQVPNKRRSGPPIQLAKSMHNLVEPEGSTRTNQQNRWKPPPPPPPNKPPPDVINVAMRDRESSLRSFEIDREKLRQWDLMSTAPIITAAEKERRRLSKHGLATFRNEGSSLSAPASGKATARTSDHAHPLINTVTGRRPEQEANQPLTSQTSGHAQTRRRLPM